MGTSRNASELASKLLHAGENIQAVGRVGVERACLVTKQTILAGAPKRLRGVGRNGVKLGVRYDVKGTMHPTGIVHAVGPWHLIESDTKPHEIKPKRRSGKRAVMTPEGPRARVMHPGTKGKHPWRNGVERARPLVHAEFQRGVHSALAKVFK